MKNRITIILFIFSCLSNIRAQDIETYKKVQLGTTETLTLNSVGGTTLSSGGKQTRNRLAIPLPAMTDFVIINVKVDNSEAQQEAKEARDMMNNLMQSKASPEVKLVGGATIYALSPPRTGYKCDFYMFPDRQNFNAFLEKGLITNYADGHITYDYPYKRTNSESFSMVVDIRTLRDKNTLYLGFRNTDNFNAIKVFVNVFALVGNGWTKEVKDDLYTRVYDGLKENGASNDAALKETCNCFVNKLTSTYTLADLNAMPEFDRNKVMETTIKNCSPDLSDSDQRSKASTYGDMGWRAYEKKEYDKCLEYSQKALSIDNSLATVHFNIGLIYLIKNQPEALEKYIDAIQLAKKNLNTTEILQAALDDIVNHEKENGPLNNSSDIKDLLKAELKQ